MWANPVFHTVLAVDVARSGPRNDDLLVRMREDLRRIVRDTFRRHVRPMLGHRLDRIEVIALPSTSPANASQTADAKLLHWRQLLRHV